MIDNDNFYMRMLRQIYGSKLARINLVKFYNFVELAKYQLLFTLFFAIQQCLNWPILKFFEWRGTVMFWDSSLVLTSADCYLSVGLAVYNGANGDPCTGYLYGSNLLKFLTFLNIGGITAPLFGWTFLIVLANIFGFLIFLSKSIGFYKASLLSLIFLSPPIFLLIERGNFDALMFISFFIAVILNSYGYKLISFIIILTISTWKFYTFPLAILTLFAIKKAYLRLFGLALFLLGIIQAIRDLSLIPNISVAVADGSFGLQVWGSYLNMLGIPIDIFRSYIFGFSLLVISWRVLIFFKSKISLDTKVFSDFGAKQRFASLLFQSSFVVFFSCYIFGLNYDYRLIFLSTACMGFILMGNNFQKLEFVQNLVLILTIACMWFSFNSNVLQPVGDFAMILLICIFTINLAILPPSLYLFEFDTLKARAKRVISQVKRSSK